MNPRSNTMTARERILRMYHHQDADRIAIFDTPWQSTPEFIDFTIKDPESWFTAKARITANSERINWKNIESDFSRWEKEGAWIQALLWFGFDITHSWIVGTERVLMALVENPEWLQDMFDTQLTVQLKLLDQLWDKSYRFQGV